MRGWQAALRHACAAAATAAGLGEQRLQRFSGIETGIRGSCQQHSWRLFDGGDENGLGLGGEALGERPQLVESPFGEAPDNTPEAVCARAGRIIELAALIAGEFGFELAAEAVGLADGFELRGGELWRFVERSRKRLGDA